jgi:hypothetical protein
MEHFVFAKQFPVLIPLAASSMEQSVTIKLLRRQFAVAMPGAASAMQFLAAKVFRRRNDAIAVKYPLCNLFGSGAHARPKVRLMEQIRFI